MPARMRMMFTLMSFTWFLIAAVAIYTEFHRRSDIWWTPFAMRVPLAQGADRVVIYARGKPLAALLQAGQVRIAGDADTSTLAIGDVTLRFNNVDRVRAQRIPLMLLYAAACGLTGCLGLLIATGRIAYRDEIAPPG
ncbi:MAG: hypothetical protein HYR74_00710 [Candidatus Eisenbacteria bacterium]|nr:hypothetical protein [Candidatus Eisenbacteria bacterium]